MHLLVDTLFFHKQVMPSTKHMSKSDPDFNTQFNYHKVVQIAYLEPVQIAYLEPVGLIMGPQNIFQS